MKRSYIFILLFVMGVGNLCAQSNPAFWPDIVAFKKIDSIQKPIPNAILFIGSSSFTKWKDVNEYLSIAEKMILQHKKI